MGIAGIIVALASVHAAPASALAADPALDALRERDAYVSPRVLGADAPAAERQLAAAAARLEADRRPVKLAIVVGPAGAPSMQVYARRLASRLRYRGTLVVTSRGGTIAATGPRATADTTQALRAGRVGRIGDPVRRLTRAATIAAPPAPDLDRAARRSTLVLILLAVLGGGWAAALGVGRHGRRVRREMTEARSRVRVCADALRAHTIALARQPDLPPAARERVERALGVYAEAISSLPELRRAEQVDALAPRVRSALDDISAATAGVTGAREATADPFAGLCGMDPAHGVATPPAPGARALCDECRAAEERGEPLSPRMLFEDGRAVPFDAARYGPVLRPDRSP